MSDVEQLPADVLQQDLPVGGAVDGVMPEVAIPVVPVGIALTRETPALQAVTISLPGTTGDVFLLVSQSPHRRRILVATTGAAVRLCTSRQDAKDAVGLRIPPDVAPVPIHFAGELFVRLTGANQEVTAFIEYDQG